MNNYRSLFTIFLWIFTFIFICVNSEEKQNVNFEINSENAEVRFGIHSVVKGEIDVKYTWINKNKQDKSTSILQLLDSSLTSVLEIDGGNPMAKVSSILLETNSKIRNKKKSSNQSHLRSLSTEIMESNKAKINAVDATSDILVPQHLIDSVKFSGNLNVDGFISMTSSGNSKVNGNTQWKLITHEDFHKGTVDGWTNSGKQVPMAPDNAVSTCASDTAHPYSDYFLGAYSAVKVSKVFKLPAHSIIKIEARFHFIDDWNGETGYLTADGKTVWSQSHNWCTKLMKTMCKPMKATEIGQSTAFTIDVCGHPDFPDKLSAPLGATFHHTADTLMLTFGSTLSTDDSVTTVATWGVDDLKIYAI